MSIANQLAPVKGVDKAPTAKTLKRKRPKEKPRRSSRFKPQPKLPKPPPENVWSLEAVQALFFDENNAFCYIPCGKDLVKNEW